LILGSYPYIPSNATYKRVILTGMLCILTLFICLAFVISDVSRNQTNAIGVLFACMMVSLVAFMLNRRGNHLTAKILLAIAVNFTLFLLSESEPLEIGLYLFFIVTCIAAIVAFGLEELPLSVLFVGLSISLFLLSLYTDFGLYPHMVADDEYIRFNILLNFLLALASAAIIVYFVVNLNYRSEKELRQNELEIKAKHEELVRLNAELDRFVYSTSHDLRSPISSMRGLVTLSRMTEDPKEIECYLKMMEDQLVKLSNFIRDIADYSRNTRLDLNKQEIEINKVVHDALESMKFLPGSNRIEIVQDIPGNLLFTTDPARLQMILSNLISNSFKYADMNKAAPFIQISARRSGSLLQLEIRDNGVGIDKQYIAKIFDMFFQAHAKAEGSGLGLYIAKEAAAKLNGQISVTSTLGEGTHFCVEIPETINPAA